MRDRRKGSKPRVDFAQFEQELHERIMGLERELLAEELERADIDAEAVEIERVTYRRAVRSVGHYQTAAGVVHVERTLHRNRSEGGRAFAALDRQVRIVEGRWTPEAAKQAAWVMTHMIPAQGQELFERMGHMTPSRSVSSAFPRSSVPTVRSNARSCLRRCGKASTCRTRRG